MSHLSVRVLSVATTSYLLLLSITHAVPIPLRTPPTAGGSLSVCSWQYVDSCAMEERQRMKAALASAEDMLHAVKANALDLLSPALSAPGGSHVVDVGCGLGADARAMAARCC